MIRKLIILFIISVVLGAISCQTVEFDDEISDLWDERSDETAQTVVTSQRENLLILPIFSNYGDSIGISLATRFLSTRLRSDFTIRTINPLVTSAIKLAEGFQETIDLQSIRDLADEYDSRYVMLGHIVWMEQYVFIISIFDTRNNQLVSGTVHQFQGYQYNHLNIETVEGMIAALANELVASFRVNKSAFEKVAVSQVLSDVSFLLDEELSNNLAQIMSIYLLRTQKYAVYPFTNITQTIEGEGEREEIPWLLTLSAREFRGLITIDAMIYDRIGLPKDRVTPEYIRVQRINAGVIPELERAAKGLTGVTEIEAAQVRTEEQRRQTQREQEQEQQRIAAITTASIGMEAARSRAYNAIDEVQEARKLTSKAKNSADKQVEARKARRAFERAKEAEAEVIAHAGEIERLAGAMISAEGREHANKAIADSQRAISMTSQLMARGERITLNTEEMVVKKRNQEINNERFWIDKGKKFWSVGANIGSSFATPVLIANACITIAPLPYLFIEGGYDFGTIHGDASSYASGRANDKEVTDIGYYSNYIYGRVNLFVPFGRDGGWYLGLGAGHMDSYWSYDDPQTIADDVHLQIFAFDFASGFFFGKENYLFRLGYSGRFAPTTESVNHRLMLGFTYRIGQFK